MRGVGAGPSQDLDFFERDAAQVLDVDVRPEQRILVLAARRTMPAKASVWMRVFQRAAISRTRRAWSRSCSVSAVAASGGVGLDGSTEVTMVNGVTNTRMRSSAPWCQVSITASAPASASSKVTRRSWRVPVSQ